LIHPVAAHQIVILSERRSLPLKRDGDVDNFRLEIGLLLFQKRKNGGLPGQELSYLLSGALRSSHLAPSITTSSIIQYVQPCGYPWILGGINFQFAIVDPKAPRKIQREKESFSIVDFCLQPIQFSGELRGRAGTWQGGAQLVPISGD
jgi:hypothetical protein